MPTISLKVSAAEARDLARRARAARQTKSAYVHSLISGRLETTDDWLQAMESGRLNPLIPRRQRRRATA